MSDWKKYYDEHLITMEQAAAMIESGDAMWVGQTIGTSYNFLQEVFNRKEELFDVTMWTNVCVGMTDMFFDPSIRGHITHKGIFGGPLDRMSQGLGIYEANSNPYEYAIRIVFDIYKINTLVWEVAPPDENGMINAGILNACMNRAFRQRGDQLKKRIAIINKYQGPAPGDKDLTECPVEFYDYFVEDDHELPYVPVSDPTEVDQKIAGYIMPYINSGDSIQIGMGGLGEQITKELYSKKNLNIYSEIVVDSMVDLIKAGHVDKVTCAGAFGTNKVYEFLMTSPLVEFREFAEMLDPMFIGNVDNMVAINSTFMVDLLGQACSEAQGFSAYSGVGGSFGYLYGATRSKGGRSFLCLRSTYMDSTGERQSNIVPWLPPQSIVSAPKYTQMYIVSEYGIADVFLKTNKDRIKALIKIAHPDYYSSLKADIISTGIIEECDFD